MPDSDPQRPVALTNLRQYPLATGPSPVRERLGVDGGDLRFGEGLGAVHDTVGV